MRIRLLLVTLPEYETGQRLRAGHARKLYLATSVPVPSYVWGQNFALNHLASSTKVAFFYHMPQQRNRLRITCNWAMSIRIPELMISFLGF
jgi:hypothetical protein